MCIQNTLKHTYVTDNLRSSSDLLNVVQINFSIRRRFAYWRVCLLVRFYCTCTSTADDETRDETRFGNNNKANIELKILF